MYQQETDDLREEMKKKKETQRNLIKNIGSLRIYHIKIEMWGSKRTF